MRTIDDMLKACGGSGPGFELVRLALASGVVVLHAFTVVNQYYPADDTPLWMFHYCLVPGFFALSGFLVTASATRLSLGAFLINRGLRILPALFVVTMVCALIIGPIFTSLPLRDYFTDRAFFGYLFNAVGWVHFELPGVFQTHPFTRVNGSLWSVPFEIGCYFGIGLLFALTARRRLALILVAASYIGLATAIHGFELLRHVANPAVAKALSAFFLEYEAEAMTAFVFGALIFVFRDRIPYHRGLFAACALTLLAIAFGLTQQSGQAPALRLILSPALAYVVVFSGLTRLYLPPFFRQGDYSYGIYLFHQPIIQIVVALAPGAALAPGYGALFALACAIPIVLFFARLSWRHIEKPALALRRRKGGETVRSAARFSGAKDPLALVSGKPGAGSRGLG